MDFHMKNKYSVNATVPYKTKITKFTKNTRQKIVILRTCDVRTCDVRTCDVRTCDVRTCDDF